MSNLTAGSSEGILSNTRWFLLEENENYNVKEQLAEDPELGAIVDPSNPPQRGEKDSFSASLFIPVG